MMETMYLRGWSIVGTDDPSPLSAQWRHRDRLRLPASTWIRAQEMADRAPIGRADRVVVLRTGGPRPVDVEFVSGSQGLPRPTEETTRVRASLSQGQTLLLDARIWVRADTTAEAEVWEQS